MKTSFIISLTITLIVLSGLAFAQDIHFSQYDASPITVNPALTGMYKDANYKFTNQYRSQWDAVTRKSYLSSILTYDMPYKQKWGMGAYLINDNSARYYNSFSFVLSGAHDITIDDQNRHKMSVGIQLGIIYKSTRLDNYLFDDQYFEGTFSSDIATAEVFDRNNRVMPEINMGVSYQNMEDNKKFNPYGGFSVFHITNPRENIISNEKTRLPLRFVLLGGSKIFISDKITLDPKFLIMRQRNAMEYNIGALSFFELQDRDFKLIGGLNYRWNDAVVITGGLFYKNFIYKVSYDVNVSTLREFSRYRGGPEFSIVFFRPVVKSARLL